MQTQPVLSIGPRLVLVVFALTLVGPQRLPGQSQYTITQITSGSPDHVSPAINNKGGIVWSQMLNGFSQVYILPKGQSSPSLLPGQQGNHNNQFPVIDDAGDVVYLKDGVGGGPGLVVVRNSGGNESTIEFSSGNPPGCTEPPAGPPTCSSFRGAGQHFGISSGGTTIRTSAKVFGRESQPHGGAHSHRDLCRINNSGDVVVVSAGQVQVYVTPTYTTIQSVNSGTWADVNDSGLVVFQNKDSAGSQQVFIATPSNCGDIRDQIIQEYAAFGVAFYSGTTPSTPHCTDFTMNTAGMAQTAFYSFTNLNSSIDPSSGQSCQSYPWAVIRSPLVAPAALAPAGFGLDSWVLQLGGAPVRPLNSVYRNPVHNFAPTSQCGGAASVATRSRHMFGDAADMRVISRTVQEWNSLFKAAQRAGAVTPEGINGPCGLACVHADWRNKPGPWINP